MKYVSQLHLIQLDRNLCRLLDPDCRWSPNSQLVISEFSIIINIALWHIQTVKSGKNVIERLSVHKI